MIYFIGVGPGPADLITVKGKELIEKADVIIYNEEKINGELLSLAKEGSAFVNVVAMNLEQIVVEMVARAQKRYVSNTSCVARASAFRAPRSTH